MIQEMTSLLICFDVLWIFQSIPRDEVIKCPFSVSLDFPYVLSHVVGSIAHFLTNQGVESVGFGQIRSVLDTVECDSWRHASFLVQSNLYIASGRMQFIEPDCATS